MPRVWSEMSLKRLESDLECLDVFKEPKISLEQYHTPPRIAAELLHAIDLDIGVSGKTVLDLGCGSGMLGLGCVNIGAERVVGIDIDEDALHIAKQNREDVGISSEKIVYLQKDIRDLQKEDLPPDLSTFDVVVTNPPFGTRCPNIDLLFVEKGLEFSRVVYSFHKSSTREFLLEKAKQMGVQTSLVLQEVKFQLPATYSFHKLEKHSIIVDVIKFARKS